ncbi:MAG: chemotaxis protein CheW [Cyanobacteria bacterium J06627_3]
MTIRPPATAADTLRLITMDLGKLTLGCRIETVYKVVKQSQIHSSGLGHTGLTHIDAHTVMVVDLHHKLFNVPTPDKQGYLVIIKPQTADLVAIPVATSPNLMDVHREHVRVLPEAYRQSDTLSIASHVAVVSHGNKPLTVFVIDENALSYK